MTLKDLITQVWKLKWEWHKSNCDMGTPSDEKNVHVDIVQVCNKIEDLARDLEDIQDEARLEMLYQQSYEERMDNGDG